MVRRRLPQKHLTFHRMACRCRIVPTLRLSQLKDNRVSRAGDVGPSQPWENRSFQSKDIGLSQPGIIGHPNFGTMGLLCERMQPRRKILLWISKAAARSFAATSICRKYEMPSTCAVRQRPLTCGGCIPSKHTKMLSDTVVIPSVINGVGKHFIFDQGRSGVQPPQKILAATTFDIHGKIFRGGCIPSKHTKCFPTPL